VRGKMPNPEYRPKFRGVLIHMGYKYTGKYGGPKSK